MNDAQEKDIASADSNNHRMREVGQRYLLPNLEIVMNELRIFKHSADFLANSSHLITMEHGQLITKKYLGEHKVITVEQQLLGLILWFFMFLKWRWLLRLFAVLL